MHEELVKRLTRTANYLAEEEWTEAATAIRDAIQALTAPQAETWEEYRDFWNDEKSEQRPWTRKDGSTTPRGDVVDRRKSAEGNKNGDYADRLPETRYGRRSADRSRWVQETPQTWPLVEEFLATIKAGEEADVAPGIIVALKIVQQYIDRRSTMK